MVDWLLIDLDNTLLDFTAGANRSLIAALKAFEIEPSEGNIDIYHTINHQCWEAFEKGELDVDTLRRRRFELFVETLAVSVDAGKLNSFYLSILSEQIDEIKGARQFLEWASLRYKLVLATNGFASVQRPRIARSQLQTYFEHIVISEEIGVQKPHAGFFDHAFEKMNHPAKERVMIIGDSQSSDINGGRNYGIRTCWLRQPGSKSVTPQNPSHLEVTSLEEIPALIEG